MATKAYEIWDFRGRPWDPAQPIAELEAWAVRNGFTVLGTIGNEEHLTAAEPKDHTPFSMQAWPVPLPGYIVCAVDIADERELGAAILAGARAGEYPWLKYLNTGQRNYHCRDGFQASVYNSDTHNHLSIRTDYINASIGDFNPLGDDMLTDDEKAALGELLTLVRSIAGRTEAQAKFTDATTWTGMPDGRQEEMKGNQVLRQVAKDVTALKTGGVDIAALAEALKPHMETAAEAAVRRVLGAVDNK